MRRTGPTNYVWRKTIRLLRKYARQYRASVWRYVAELLERPARRRVIVNVSKINRYAQPGEIVVVPGKVLGAGMIEKPITVAAMAFSMSAIEKIKATGGRVIHILDLLNENPRGSRVRIII